MSKQKKIFFFLLFILSVNNVIIANNNNYNLCAEDFQPITRNGAWCWFSDPRAIYVEDKIFGGFVDNEGSIWAFSYDPSTYSYNQHKLYDKLNYDDHAAPSMMKLPDNRLVIFFSAHGGQTNKPIFYAVSKNPADISSWNTLQSVDPVMSGKLGVCYTNPAMLSSEKNRTYLFFRGKDFKPTCIYSDDLSSWSKPINIVRNDDEYGAEGRPYMKVATNHKDKIFFAFTDAHPRDRATNSIYFMMYNSGKLCKADGSVISDSLGSIKPSMADKVYDATITFDKAWIWDVAFDNNENPVLVYTKFSDRDNSHSYWYALWNGKKWENYKITEAGQWFQRKNYVKETPEFECNYSGGVYLDHNNTNVVYTSRPINDIFEIEKWTFDIKSKKWSSESVTENSVRDNVRPFVVRDYKEKQPSLLWMYNYSYPGFRAFNSAIRINQKAKIFNDDLNKKNIEIVANSVFDWIIDEYSNGNTNICNQGWVSGVLYNGMFDWADCSNNNTYLDFLKKIFSGFSWQVGNRMYHADDLCVGQAYLDMYKKYADENMLIPSKARVDWIMDNLSLENIDIRKGKSERWWWCDALYMAPPLLSRLYTITGEKDYIKFAHKEFMATYNHLYDKKEHLFYRDGRFLDKKNSEGKNIFWSRGNGWVLAGLAEFLKNLPSDDKKYRPFYEQLFKDMCERIAELQESDGYWRSDLLSKDIYPMPETSGTGLFTYAMMYGINSGLLDKDYYFPIVKKGWSAMVNAVDTEGKVGWTQMVADKPGNVRRNDTRGYSSGALLMIASELYKYLGE